MNRTTNFLLALVFVLACLFVALEWNSGGDGWHFFDMEDDLEAEMELSPLHRDEDEVPMMKPTEETPPEVKSQEVNPVEEDVEIPPEEVEPAPAEMQDPPKPEEEKLPEAVDMYDEPVDFRVVEDLPQFPGGAVEFMKWLTKYLHYPPSAQQRKVQGKVVAQFIVEKDGKVSNAKVKVPLFSECDKEAIRGVMAMPKWKPGKNMGKPVRCFYQVPVTFRQ